VRIANSIVLVSLSISTSTNVVLSSVARADVPTEIVPQTDPAMHEEVVRIAFDATPTSPMLQTTLFEPLTGTHHPLIIFSHGVPRTFEDRARMTRWRPVEQARWFVDRGFVVAVPMRRGYAQSTGAYAENNGGTCVNSDYVVGPTATAQDIRAVLVGLAARPEIDTSKTLLLGHSGGGMGSLAFASEQPAGVLGVLNFAGGRGSASPGAVCSPENLAIAMKKFGSTTKVPSLWFYAANDQAFSPFIAHLMFDGFGGEKQHAHFVALPAFKDDGHAVIADPQGMPLWTPEVSAFLKKLGLENAKSP
jgi:dienelactone hydrolase